MMSGNLKYSELKNTDFFNFFNLKEGANIEISENSRKISFKPGGFQEFIDISIEIKNDIVNKSYLILDQNWIGNSDTINPFGKDITKSFIATFISPEIKSEFRDSLITSLWNLKGSKDVVICMDKVVKAWEESDIEVKKFLDVYRGFETMARKIMNNIEIMMENIKENNKIRLEITISYL